MTEPTDILMTEQFLIYPNDSRGDVQAWGLTHVQAARYHARLGTYHARQARHYADKAVRSAKVPGIVGVAALVLLLLLIGVLLGGEHRG
ncbi:hypothetical protein [Actinoplanes siamensis]|uniref:Uncharacterized protein n=1 Tax=Actinoplanes siamensis TaxID=1223317 RepID=A0A919TNG0_9ACTN|nr:hypothetical protein [Actinoplanes siamensis]GIF08694.1 hypothetical protein Asi03nite_62320 [Actinoplanes siamensis]